MKLESINTEKNIGGTPLTNNGKIKKHPEINFKYLYKCDTCCLKGLSKYDKKHKEEKVFDNLQRFLHEIDACTSLEEMIKNYTSPKGSKIQNSEYVKQLIKKFENVYPNEKGLVGSGIIHIHTQKGGKGKFVIFGVNYENVFYVLSFDPGHTFC